MSYMGGFYLEDFAVWVRTQKGSILRGVICAIIVVLMGVTIVQAFMQKDDLAETIRANDEVLAQDDYDLNRLNEIRSGINRQTGHELFTPADDGGNWIARLQTLYGSFQQDDAEDVTKHLTDIRNGRPDGSTREEQNGLRAYVSSDSLCNPWYSNLKAVYTWDCASKETVVTDNVTEVSGIFVCTYGRTDKILAIGIGIFDWETGLLSSVDVYTTYPGQKLLADKNVTSVTQIDPTPGDLLKYDNFNRDEISWRLATEGVGFDSESSDIPENFDVSATESGSPSESVNPDVSPAPDASDQPSGGFDLNQILEGLGQ